ncbi:MAG: BspA family leucine-rich repeat surface protein [Bacteroidia bacterium]
MKKFVFYLIIALSAFVFIYSCSTEEEETTLPPSTVQTPEPETEPTQYTLTVTAAEGGSVSTEGGTFDEGTEVTITATPAEGYQFIGWEGSDSDSNSISISITSDLTLQANFSQAYTLEINQGEGGSIIGEAGAYTSETEITLEAVPADGYIFKNWVGLSETSPSVTITLSENLVVSAVFIEQSQTAFISKWNIGENKEIKITLSESYNYNFSIDWGDGTSETFEGNISEITHEYANSGEFDITIEEGENGSFPFIKIDDPTSRISIIEITQWGNIAWQSFTKSFRDCENLDITATDSPILSNVEQMNEAFWGCNSLLNENESISDWDISNVTDISYIFLDTKIDIPLNWDLTNIIRLNSMFEQTNFNQDISDWNISNAQYINGLFFNNESFNQDISSWDTSNVLSMNRTFLAARSFNQDITGWDVSNVTDMQFMFGSANKFNQNISNWDVSNVQRFDYMFSKADTFDQNLAEWDISSMESAAGMFQNVTLSTDNYDAILIGWSTLIESEERIPTNINIDFGNSIYSVCGGGHKARNILINEYGWTITDSGMLEDDIVIDVQGNEYGAVNINGKLWTACNAKTTTYINGDPIFDEFYKNIRCLATSYVECNDDVKNQYIDTFGRLYTRTEVVDERGIAPDGWRVPSREDYQSLIDSFENPTSASIALKSSKLTDPSLVAELAFLQILNEGRWYHPGSITASAVDRYPTNSSGFSALPGGDGTAAGCGGGCSVINRIGENAVFITSSFDRSPNEPIFIQIPNFHSGSQETRIGSGGSNSLGSLRFVKDVD